MAAEIVDAPVVDESPVGFLGGQSIHHLDRERGTAASSPLPGRLHVPDGVVRGVRHDCRKLGLGLLQESLGRLASFLDEVLEHLESRVRAPAENELPPRLGIAKCRVDLLGHGADGKWLEGEVRGKE